MILPVRLRTSDTTRLSTESRSGRAQRFIARLGESEMGPVMLALCFCSDPFAFEEPARHDDLA